MQEYSEILSLIVIFIIFIVFLLLFKRKKLKIEFDKDIIYQERCEIKFSGKFNRFFGGNLPFGYLIFYDNFVVIDYMTPITLNYVDIESVKLYEKTFSKYLIINIKKDIISKDVIVYPKNIKAVLKIFTDKNVSIMN